jgi:N,N'-diacetyllegionaminate synthase
VELLRRVAVSAWKVASGKVSHIPRLARMATTGLLIIFCSGMSPPSELDTAVELVKARGLPLSVLQCTSTYPCPPEKIGLNLIPFFRERYDCRVGLSNHSGTIYSGLAAATLSIEVLELHVTLSREMFGPDVPASITTAELR